MGTNPITCRAITCRALTCCGTLTCGANSISTTVGTSAFSVTPTMMKALYTYYSYMGPFSTTVGTLNSW